MSDPPPTTLREAMQSLEVLGSAAVKRVAIRHGAGENQFGVKLGDIRAIAKSIKRNHALGRELWATGNADAMLLATRILDPRLLTEGELEEMVASAGCSQVADWLNSVVVKCYAGKEAVRERWMDSPDPMIARAGWSLTAERISREPAGLNLPALLDRIEREMGSAPPLAQWTMNYCLAEIGIGFPEHRSRAVAIGEALGVFRDFPVSKGCTSPFAPIWIRAMVARQG